jgi:hypothetical protein
MINNKKSTRIACLHLTNVRLLNHCKIRPFVRHRRRRSSVGHYLLIDLKKVVVIKESKNPLKVPPNGRGEYASGC